MSGMQRLNMLAGILTFLYGAWRGWPLMLSLEKGLLAYVTVFGAQILVITALLRLARSASEGRE